MSSSQRCRSCLCANGRYPVLLPVIINELLEEVHVVGSDWPRTVQLYVLWRSCWREMVMMGSSVSLKCRPNWARLMIASRNKFLCCLG